jgi:outer membrane protein TolC
MKTVYQKKIGFYPALALIIFGIGVSKIGSSAESRQVLGLKDFLHEVETGNQSIKAFRDSSQGAELRAAESRLLLAPTAFANFQYSDDKRQTLAPIFQGRQTQASSYSLGISQQTSFGLQGKLSYNLFNTSLVGVDPGLVPQSSYYEARPVLELTMSLWRNGFGRETRANQQVLESQAMATSFSDSYSLKTSMANAETAYWGLVLAREGVRIQRESLTRFERIRDIYLRRSKLDLSDRADLLQSEASVRSRQLELQSAIDNERVAARNFNTLREVQSDDVVEMLDPITPEVISQLHVPERAQFRDDVKAAQHQEKLAVANSQIGRERNSPTLELFASLSTNGRNPNLVDAGSLSLSGQYPWNTFGLRFSTPLDLDDLSKSRDGYRHIQESAEVRLKRVLFEQERDWNDLNKRFTESKNRLEIARSVEAMQKEKLLYEKSRLTRGRTTTFQVIIFEQEYALSQLAHIQAQATVLQLVAQMKTFGGNQ